MGVPARQRLRKQARFLKVRSDGRRVHCGPFIFQCRPAEEGAAPKRLFGVIASRRVGNAVKRNYGKRVFRELFRLHQEALPPGSETVVVLRAGFDRCPFSELEARFLDACGKVSGGGKGGPR